MKTALENTCNYKKSELQPENIPYPRVQFESECGFKLVLTDGYDMNWKDHEKYGTPILPRGKCMKCNKEITNL